MPAGLFAFQPASWPHRTQSEQIRALARTRHAASRSRFDGHAGAASTATGSTSTNVRRCVHLVFMALCGSCYFAVIIGCVGQVYDFNSKAQPRSFRMEFPTKEWFDRVRDLSHGETLDLILVLQTRLAWVRSEACRKCRLASLACGVACPPQVLQDTVFSN